jgi:hypothetical protein
MQPWSSLPAIQSQRDNTVLCKHTRTPVPFPSPLILKGPIGQACLFLFVQLPIKLCLRQLAALDIQPHVWGHEEGYHVVFVEGIIVVPIPREVT